MMTDIAISPRYRAADLDGADLAKKVDIFEDQMRGWLLDHAELLASPVNPRAQHAGFALLTILSVYAEAIACFIKGMSSDGQSRDFFVFGLGQVFPGFEDPALHVVHKAFYHQVRCGQLHQGLVRGKVSIVRGGAVAIAVARYMAGSVTGIQIDPWLLLAYVTQHFTAYLAVLRDERRVAERERFEVWFDRRAA